MKKILILYIFVFHTLLSFSNTDNKTDSLINSLKSDTTKNKYKIHLKIANNLMYSNNKLAYKYAIKSLNGSIEKKDSIYISSSYRILGALKSFQANFDTALVFYYKSINISKLTNDSVGIATSLLNIGAVYNNIQKYDDAIKSYKEAYDIFIRYNKYLGAGMALNNIGFSYKTTFKDDSALYYYEKALEIKYKIGDKKSIASTLANIGNIYSTEKNDFKKAIEYNLKALEIFEDNDDMYNLSLVCNSLGTSYLNINEIEKSKLYFQRSISISKEHNYLTNLRTTYFYYAKLYIKQNDYKKAYDYQVKYFDLRLAELEKEKDNAFAKMQVEFETEKLKQQNVILAQKAELDNVKLKARTYWLAIFIVGFIVAIIFGIIVFFQFKNLKQAYKSLVKQNIDIATSEKELHDTKNELEAIIDNKKSIEEIKESKKYKDSALTDTQKDDILGKVIYAMEQDKVFTDIDLTIIKFAESIGTNKTYVSQIINQEYNSNFSNYLNNYRIKEARILLTDPENFNITIAAIAEQVGFKSISVFNKAFKNFTGLTPSYFLKSIKENK